MFASKKLKLAAALAAAGCITSVHAVDIAGFEFNGYSRGGPTLNPTDGVKGGLTLGGDMQKFRLGNEGDYGIEVNFARTFDLQGTKFKVDYMPSKWNSGSVNTEQAYVEVSGLTFSPEAKFWVGQRRLRLQDVHIVDYFFMNYGDNEGGGVLDIPVGGAKAGFAIFSGDKFDSQLPAGVRATRFNAEVYDIDTNPGGKLRFLATVVHGTGLANSNTGSGLSMLHNQGDFLVKGLSNAFFVQASRGHARIDGEFESIDGVNPGKRVWRIGDSPAWQFGPLGGQALIAYQKSKNEATDVVTKDFSLGGRISYAMSKNFKMLVEAATTSRKIDGQADQRLNKITVAPTLSVGEGFWERPELRFYVTRANWNDAAQAANASTFGQNGKKSRTLAGVQYEIWW